MYQWRPRWHGCILYSSRVSLSVFCAGFTISGPLRSGRCGREVRLGYNRLPARGRIRGLVRERASRDVLATADRERRNIGAGARGARRRESAWSQSLAMAAVVRRRCWRPRQMCDGRRGCSCSRVILVSVSSAQYRALVPPAKPRRTTSTSTLTTAAAAATTTTYELRIECGRAKRGIVA